MDNQPADPNTNEPEPKADTPEAPAPQAEPTPTDTPQPADEQAPQAVVSQQPRNRKKVGLILLALIVLLAVAAGLAYNQLKGIATKPTHTASAKTADPYLVSPAKYICVSAASKAILCEDVTTGKLTKYVLPDSFGVVFRVNISPDRKKLQLSTFDANNTVHDLVVNRDMKTLKVLHIENNNEDGYNYTWTADSSKLIYDLRTTGSDKQFGPSALYVYDLAAGTSKQLTHSSDSIDYPVLMKNGMIVARKEAEGRQDPVIVNPTTGELSPVEVTAFLKGAGDYPTIDYNIGTDAFYVADRDDKLLRVGQLHGTAGTYRIDPVQTIHGKVFANMQLVTAKGTPVQFGKTINDTDIRQLFDGGTVSTTTVNMGAQMSFTAAQLPFTNPAPTNKVVKSDYLSEIKTPPANLQAFLESHLSDGCKAGQYRQVVLLGFNSDGTQAALSEGGCGFNADYETIYIYQDGKYKSVGSSQEGFDCSLRDKYNISTAVLPACHKPGDEL